MSTRSRYLRLLPAAAVAIGILIAIGLVYWLKQTLSGPMSAPKPVVQQITLIQPPPPPPPPPQETPPEPEEQVKTPEPEPEAPQDQPSDDAPAGEDLGVDADGSAGGDSFGLVGKKGGRGLIGGGGGDPRFTWYTRRLDQDLTEFFNEYKELRKIKRYSVDLNLWIDASGKIERFQVVNASENPVRDAIHTVLGGLGRVSPPPEGTPQPVRLRLSSRG